MSSAVSVNKCLKALLVLLLTPAIFQFLGETDPKALEQALLAALDGLTSTDAADPATQRQLAGWRRLLNAHLAALRERFRL